MMCGRWRLRFGKPQIQILMMILAVGAFNLACQPKNTNFLKTDEVQLAPPRIAIDSLLFIQSATVQLSAGSEEATIKYTLDGSDVNSDAPDYTSPLAISSSTQIKVRAFHPEYSSSDTEERTLIKMSKDISGSEIMIQPDAHSNYAALGPQTLVDGRKGEFNFRSGNRWLGFQSDEVIMDLEFSEPTAVKKVFVGLLRDQGAWIFFPKTIEVKALEKSIGYFNVEQAGVEESKKMRFMEIPVEQGEYDQITITIKALEGIPDWHPGKGTMPWTFVDEILIE